MRASFRDEPAATRSFAFVDARGAPSDNPFLNPRQAAAGLKGPPWSCASVAVLKIPISGASRSRHGRWRILDVDLDPSGNLNRLRPFDEQPCYTTPVSPGLPRKPAGSAPPQPPVDQTLTSVQRARLQLPLFLARRRRSRCGNASETKASCAALALGNDRSRRRLSFAFADRGFPLAVILSHG